MTADPHAGSVYRGKECNSSRANRKGRVNVASRRWGSGGLKRNPAKTQREGRKKKGVAEFATGERKGGTGYKQRMRKKRGAKQSGKLSQGGRHKSLFRKKRGEKPVTNKRKNEEGTES